MKHFIITGTEIKLDYVWGVHCFSCCLK